VLIAFLLFADVDAPLIIDPPARPGKPQGVVLALATS